MARPRPSRAFGLAALLAVAAATALVAARYPNFHEVDPGGLYRSGQLSPGGLARVIERHGIRTVVNLRGASDADWYRAEAAVARAHGVQLVDISLSSRRLPHPDEVAALLDAFRDAERPILVHCFSGADRTGLAAAVYALEVQGRSREEALSLLTLRTLHAAFLAPAMRRFVELYRGEAWARTEYDPCTAGDRFYPQQRYCPLPPVAAP